jgi:hypothetical protein
MQTDDGCDRCSERSEWSPVVGVHDPPGLEVCRLFDLDRAT